MSDYIRAILKVQDPKETNLLSTLERYFLAWRDTRNKWRFWSAKGALLAAGLIVAIVVAIALFYTDLIEKLALPERARGLITFLFSFITIAVILIVIIALLWMDKEEDIDNRFTKAKDIIAILVGILGTIVGFYFGSNPAPTSIGTPQAALCLRLIRRQKPFPPVSADLRVTVVFPRMPCHRPRLLVLRAQRARVPLLQQMHQRPRADPEVRQL